MARCIPATLAALGVLGVTRVFKVGGAQAIAALAYGTKTIPKVDKIVGPGSIWVTLAKKLVYGEVGIDGLYGPSEVVILADEERRPAPDRGRPAGAGRAHGGLARDPGHPGEVAGRAPCSQELEKQLERLSREGIGRGMLSNELRRHRPHPRPWTRPWRS